MELDRQRKIASPSALLGFTRRYRNGQQYSKSGISKSDSDERQSIIYRQLTNHLRESAHSGCYVAVTGVEQAEPWIWGSPITQDLDQAPLGERFSCVPFTHVRKSGTLQGGAQNQAIAVKRERTSDIYTQDLPALLKFPSIDRPAWESIPNADMLL